MPQIASPLSRKATLVGVVISQWTARKLDKRVTDEVNKSHGASADAGRYNKLLIEAERLAKINSIVSRARDAHYRFTRPWADEGLRILPNTLHAAFTDQFRALKREFEQAADEFCAEYPFFIEERKHKLNGLFNESDYPRPDAIRSKFKLAVRQTPVPDAGDFRSDVLDEATVEDIRRELVQSEGELIDDARKHTLKQIAEVVGHLAERLRAYNAGAGDGKRSFFRASLVENVRELADLLPSFNFTNDPAFDALTARIKSDLCVEEVETLRKEETVRASVAKSADDILKDVEALLG